MTSYDAIVVGAGPAGAVCAGHLAAGGRRTLLLDRARFPRDKVCGDCLNPAVLPVLDRLGLRERLSALTHAVATEVSFHGINGEVVRIPSRDEWAVRRRDLDALLVARAQELGAEFRDECAALRIASGWTVETSAGTFRAPLLFAADGRNSTVARLAGRLPPAASARTALQCHAPLPPDHGAAVRMHFHARGYGGTAPIGADLLNICLVAPGPHLAELRRDAERWFGLAPNLEWRTIAPLDRAPARVLAADGLFLLGDSARVVEPFTGEGIYYAMRSGELAAQAVLGAGDPHAAYRRAHAGMYRGRLWINRLARLAGTHPRLTSAALRGFRHWPAPLGALTAKVVR